MLMEFYFMLFIYNIMNEILKWNFEVLNQFGGDKYGRKMFKLTIRLESSIITHNKFNLII